MPDISHVNWLVLGIGAVVLVVGWTILRTVLRLTMRMFALGCVGLVVLVGIAAVASYFLTR